ncbi:Pr6Pr family membrane protein [Rhodanobacter sp. DHG33]|uniref:Pr6Pr family membrane protein n=1 Tax=Rhodanobacter sp. DHG33 TaxID=2775921 RepID=UPI001783184F|nr:Pr6Pr family membrane protein [Rhodanobacter sp. DHG33]MBD8899573.1 Pr6Pr family membrane protein [Rhodanobacter sp. DHG33]
MQQPPDRLRTFAAVAALLGWITLALQLLLTIQMSIGSGRGIWHGVWIYLDYFTILTNVLAALVLTAAAHRSRGALGCYLVRTGVQTATAMSIIIVALVYNLMLRQLWQPHGWRAVADNMLHVAMPALFLLHWWLSVPKQTLRWPQAFAWQAYPAAYFIYVLLRGAMDGRYPYPFLDVAALGYLRVLIDACAVLLAFVAVAWVLIALGHWQARRSTQVRASRPR